MKYLYLRRMGLILFTASVGFTAMAETPGVLPVPSMSTLTPAPAANTGGFYQDPATIQNNLPIDNVTGREQKANDATGQSAAAAQAAHSAGGALMGAAAAAFAALNIPLGITLTVMGATEFSQRNKNYEVQAMNNANENLLRANPNAPAAQSPYDPDATASALLNDPAIANGLAAAGISDPQSFLNGVTSGQFTNPTQVLDSMGQLGNYTTDQVAAMGDFSQVNVAGIIGEEGNAAASVLSMDESKSSATPGGRSLASTSNGSSNSSSQNSGSANGSGAGGTGAGGSGANGANGAGSDADGFARHGGGKGRKGGDGASGSASASLGTNGEAAGSFGLGGGRDGVASAAALSAMDRAELKTLGILKPRGKQTIFQIASRNYKSFQSWRNYKMRSKPISKSTQVANANGNLN